MSFFKSPQNTQASQAPAAAGITIQSSAYGTAITVCYGTNRLAPQLIWYGDFIAIPVVSVQGGGGKGGGGSPQTSTSYSYFAALAFALCDGPIIGIGRVYADKSVFTLSSLGFESFLGAYPQSPWSYLVGAHPDQALGYNGVAYVAASSYSLGSSAQLPNHNFEVSAAFSASVPGAVDADPSLIVNDILTNPTRGMQFPAGHIGDRTTFQNYVLAENLLMSPVYASQTPCASIIDSLLLAANTDCIWSEGLLKFVPRGDTTVTGNGKVYTPPIAPVYDLNDDDFMPSSGAGDDPVTIARRRSADVINWIQAECFDRSKNYNPTIVEAKNQAAIDTLGPVQLPSQDAHMFADPAIAGHSVQLQLQRQAIQNTYQCILDARYLLLEPTDWVSLTRPGQGLDRQSVKIIDIKENDDDTYTVIAEDYPVGVGAAALYPRSQGSGYSNDFNVAPGNCQAPLIFEPTDQVAGGRGLEVWLATAGGPDWGGCQVWVSTESQENYKLAGRMAGPSRYGVTTAIFQVIADALAPPTIDEVNTLSVDIATARGQLLSGTKDDAVALNTLCYVDGEYVSYENAVLTATGKYNLSFMVRGALGTAPATHAAGVPFARLDDGIFKIPFTQDRIGKTIYIKLLAFNVYGSAQQTLAEVSPVVYTITGVALASPLPNVSNLRTVFKDGFEHLWFDEIEDFRSGIRYLIKKGTSYSGAQQIADVAHPDFPLFGPGTYWVVGYCQPAAGLLVFSDEPQSIVIAGNMLVSNLITSIDFKARGWPGAFANVGLEGVAPAQLLRLTGAANVLAEPNFLGITDLLNDGGIALSGTWTGDASTWVNVGYVAPCYVNASWLTVGLPVGQNILGLDDFLNTPDLLGGSTTQYVTGWIEIAYATVITNDAFASVDIFSEGDAFTTGVEWSAWQRFVPGVYNARLLKFRAVLETQNGGIIAYMLSASVQVSVAPRIDHYQAIAVPSGGVTIAFVPDNSTDLANPFNGGPLIGGVQNQNLPFVQVSWSGHPDATWMQDSLSLAALVGHFEDGSGAHVAVSGVNFTVEGY